MLPAQTDRDPIDCIAEEFSQKHRHGQQPQIEDFANRYPAHASRIRALFPALIVMEELRASGKVTIAESEPRGRDGASAIVHLGGYSILREVGRGGMGVVYEAVQHSLARRVALKVLPLCAAMDPERRERFAREAKAAASLDHPNIVPVYDVGEHDGHAYFSMKFVEGTTLADRVESGPLAPRDAAALLLTIVRAIAETHRCGVLHRDLKPSNVLLDKDDRPLITDFGLAKSFEDERNISQTNATLGTPNYMAPEQAMGRAEQIGVATDVYGLGAILYQALTARPPFQSASVVDTLRQVVNQDPASPRQLNAAIGRDLDTICMRCLEKEPLRRYPTAIELAEDLERYLHGKPIKARPAGRIERAVRWCKRAPMRATALGLLMMTCGVTVVSYLRTAAALSDSERSHEQTRQVVDHFLRRISEDPRLNERGMQSLRRDLLDQALIHYQRFIDQRGDDPSLQEELADTHFRVGLIREKIEDLSSARHAFAQAEDVQRTLVATFPDRADLVDALSKTLASSGRVHQRSGRFKLAREYFVEVEQLRQQLVDRFPQIGEYHRLLANAIMNLGLLDKARGDLLSALQRLSHADEIRQGQLAEASNDVEMRRDRGKGLFNLAQLQIAIGDRADEGEVAINHYTRAKNAVEEAIQLFESLVSDVPEPPDLHYQLALCYSAMGDATRRLGSKQATEWHQRVFERVETLTQDNPEVVDYQITLGAIYLSLGQTAFQDGQTANAVELFREARRIYRALVRLRPGQPALQREYAVALRAVGELEAILGRLVVAREQLTGAQKAFAELADRYPDQEAYAAERDACSAALQAVDERLGKLDMTVR
jgi:serine/threonine-protein kinase